MSAEAIASDKERAALYALSYVEPGMTVGLGTGSTADHFIKGLAAEARAGLKVRCVATSERSAELGRAEGLEVLDLSEVVHVDLTVDGADEADPALRLIKGGGGALLREKIVAQLSDVHVTVVDGAKLVPALGRFPLPVEVVPFGLEHTRERVAACAVRHSSGECTTTLRRTADGAPFVTDGGHYILDIACGVIRDPESLGAELLHLAAVVEHGLFLGITHRLVAAEAGSVRVIARD